MTSGVPSALISEESSASTSISRPSIRRMVVLGLLALLGVAVVVGGRQLLAAWQPGRLVEWAYLLRQPLEQQLTGFAVVALLVVGLILPLARELGASRKGLWIWRTVHTSLGTLALFALVAHTGLRLGSNLNLWLSGAFVLLCLFGAVAAIGMGRARTSRAWLRPARQLHILLFWPALALLGLHVFACYYF